MFSSISCIKRDYPVKEVEVKALFDVMDLNPKIGKLLFPTNNYFSVDEKENFYFLNSENHRILKFSKNGKFTSQIGSIGQGKEDLYYPAGISVNKSRVFVINEGVKIFTTDGMYQSGFKIPNFWIASSIHIYKNLILVDVRYKDTKNYNKQSLISVFDINGNYVNKFGRIIECQKWGGYLNFNSYFIDVVDEKIYGTFPIYPIIFCYDFNGKELFFKDLRNDRIEEINQIQNEIIERGMDTPDTIHKEEGTSTLEFCRGFGVSDEKHIFYALNIYKPIKKHYILHFDEEGNLKEKIILKKDNTYLKNILRFSLEKNNTFYGIGSYKDKIILFKFYEKFNI